MRSGAVPIVRAYTLTELMIVLIIIGILATLSIVQLSGPKEQALEKEAKANLKLISAAEKIYRMESGSYVDAGNETLINQVLRLMLPANDTSKNWAYCVTTTGSGTGFIATATRTKGQDIRTYTIDQEEEEPQP